MNLLKCIILLLPFTYTTYGQILKDAQMKSVVVDGLNKSYNFQFAEAEENYKQIKLKYPNNPAYYTLMHMMLYTQYAPIKDHPKIKAQYLYHLNKAVELSEKMIKKNENDAEAIFFMLSSLGSLAAWEADNDEMLKGVNTARKAFPNMKKGMKLTESHPDFLFTTGLYNYYIEQYPEDHPIVKPFMIFFSDGNKKLGLSQMEQCSKKAIFTYVESGYYAAYIYLKHENRPDKALPILDYLLEKYPNNLLFRTKYTEALIGLNKFELANKSIENLVNQQGKFYPVAVNIFKGIIEEKLNKNDKDAIIYYKKALKIPIDVRLTKDYHAMGHLGLGRIALRENNKVLARQYLKKAAELSEYVSTSAEAKRYLKDL
jgi:tetratricopeptide (TPR) repeat protein